MSEYIKGSSYNKSWVNRQRTKVAHKMQEDSKSKALESMKGKKKK